ncbi:MAG: endoglucanase [Saprospiraceae bacterium]|jgi:endoglucanase
MALYSSKPKLTKMKPILLLIILNLILISCETAKKSEYQKSEQVEEDDETPFWDEQQKGANYFNATPTEEWFDAALNTNIKFIRLTYEKWEGEQRDFLLGNADDYQGIVESDFQKLIYYLDYAHKLNINIVITPLNWAFKHT